MSDRVGAALKGALFGVLFVTGLRWLLAHFAYIVGWGAAFIVVLMALSPLLNDNANDDEMRDQIRFLSSQRYEVDGQRVTLIFENRSRFNITSGEITCSEGRQQTAPFDIGPRSTVEVETYFEGKVSEPCALTYTPVEKIKPRYGSVLIYSKSLEGER